MENISGFGLRATLIASRTFPLGLGLTSFADDTDPLDIPTTQIADSAMGLNGDLIVWSTANPLIVNLSVVPLSEDDLNLSILLEANRVGRGKNSARDIITLNLIYPSGRYVSYANGIITEGMLANAVASAGRLKSKTYNFAFEAKVGV